MDNITVLLDMRCLQDAGLRNRGISSHATSFLNWAGSVSRSRLRLVAMVDPGLPTLDESTVASVDAVVQHANPVVPRDGAVFVTTSPMTHQPSRFMRLVGHENVLSAALIYDFTPNEPPGSLAGTDAALRFAACVQWLKLYDLFFPVSHLAAKRLWHYTLVPENSTFVTGCALRASLLEALRTDEPLRIGLPPADSRYFVLATGDDAPDSFDVALEALTALHWRGRRDVSVRIVGVPSTVAVRRLSTLPVGLRERVEVIREVPDRDLRRIYAGAIATIVPSRMEGFPLPILESLACGTPAIASASDANRELIDDDAALFDPADPGALAAHMEAALGDRDWRGRMIASQGGTVTNAAPERVWRRFWSPLLEAFGRRGLGRNGMGGKLRRSRIALVTPFPPDESGVARYSEDTVAALVKLCDVSVFTDAIRSTARSPAPARIAGRIDVGTLLDTSFDAVILVTGNSHFHDRILDLCERYGGPTIQHDSRMTQIYAERWGRAEFRRRAGIAAGRPATDEELDQWLGDEKPPSPFLEPIIGTASPLIVHTGPFRALVESVYGMQAALVPFATRSRFGVRDLGPAGREAARARIGVAPGRLLISTFGYAQRSKGTLECVMALRQLRDWNIAAELHVVGSTEGLDRRLEELAKELRLSNAVRTYPQFVAEDLYADYLLASDVGIQLRSYGFGQFSAALAECIATGMACVASAELAEACEAPGFVRPVPMGANGLQIAEGVRALCESGATQTRLHPERGEYIERHSFDMYAQRLLHVLGL
jgi:glycosyltransferase involved in cell wall biosynthesis